MAGKMAKAAKEVGEAVLADVTIAPAAVFGWRWLWNKITQHASTAAEKEIKALSQAQKRQALAEALVEMDWAEKNRILLRLKRARSQYKETELVQQLGEFLCAGETMKELAARKAILTKFNATLPDGLIDPLEEGNILIELLDDNGLKQKFEWTERKSRTIRKEVVQTYLPEAKRQLENAGDALASRVGSARSWLRRH